MSDGVIVGGHVVLAVAALAVFGALVFLYGAFPHWSARLKVRWFAGPKSVPKAIILGGCLLFLLCGLFPPWLYTRSGHTERSAGYCFLLTAPQPKTYSNSGIRLDVERLAIEWLCILVGSGMGLALFAKSGREEGKPAEVADSDKHAATTPPPATGSTEAAAGQIAAKPESPSPPAAKIRRPLWMTLTSLVSLAIIVVSLVVWLAPKPKPQPRTDKFGGIPTWDYTSPVRPPVKELSDADVGIEAPPPVRPPVKELSDADVGIVATPQSKPKRQTPRPKTQKARGPRLAGSQVHSGGAGLYIGEGGGHWIESVMDDGSVIKLEDDSLWQVSPLDVIDSALWLPISDITVIEGDDPGYPHKLVNKDDGEVVNARLVSQ
jgi:hypothetical protein